MLIMDQFSMCSEYRIYWFSLIDSLKLILWFDFVELNQIDSLYGTDSLTLVLIDSLCLNSSWFNRIHSVGRILIHSLLFILCDWFDGIESHWFLFDWFYGIFSYWVYGIDSLYILIYNSWGSFFSIHYWFYDWFHVIDYMWFILCDRFHLFDFISILYSNILNIIYILWDNWFQLIWTDSPGLIPCHSLSLILCSWFILIFLSETDSSWFFLCDWY